jgi:hypothetical protein
VPEFIDFHPALKLSKETIAKIARETRDGLRDRFGVKQVELYHNDDEGKVFCVLDGPDAEAVRMHHEAMGLSTGEIHEVQHIGHVM